MQELEFFGKTRGKITDSTADVVVKVFCQDAKKDITATRFSLKAWLIKNRLEVRK